MIVKSQIKFWVFGAVGVIGLGMFLTSLFGKQAGFGITLIAAAIGMTILGFAWNAEKDGEKASTYRREARDETARQELMNVLAKGAKQLEAPKQQPAE